MTNKTMMNNLPQQTIDRIEKDAEAYGESHQDHLTNIKEYSTYADLVSGYNAGALHEAERAQGLVDALENILKQHDYYSVIEIAANALAKYKEVSNG